MPLKTSADEAVRHDIHSVAEDFHRDRSASFPVERFSLHDITWHEHRTTIEASEANQNRRTIHVVFLNYTCKSTLARWREAVDLF